LLNLYPICACSEPKLQEGHDRGDRVGQVEDSYYMYENKQFID
jgi:hypothetical protein